MPNRINCLNREIACGVMFRKECLFDIGLYNEKFKMREGHELKKRFEKYIQLFQKNEFYGSNQ